MTTEENVRRIINDFLEPAEGWSLTSSFTDLGSDSLAMMEVIMEVEDSFDVEISDEIVETLQTPKDLINFLDKE
tara:strand:+ start:443 stop:664 length:222 start_codon:yes stop_codon:yes gene_type:complete